MAGLDLADGGEQLPAEAVAPAVGGLVGAQCALGDAGDHEPAGELPPAARAAGAVTQRAERRTIGAEERTGEDRGRRCISATRPPSGSVMTSRRILQIRREVPGRLSGLVATSG